MDHFISHDIMAELGWTWEGMIVTSGREAAAEVPTSLSEIF